MKKLLITIFAVFIISSSNAEEPINLLCDAIWMYRYNNNPDNEFKPVSGTKALTIFPQSKIYIIGNDEGIYKEIGNLITWRTWLINSEPYVGDEYVLDRFTGEFTGTFGGMIDGSFNHLASTKYKCNKTEPLF